ncbi:MAG: 4a-hydroxytetrahydrobiopterin dehydratase [Phycisphaerales bacterium]
MRVEKLDAEEIAGRMKSLGEWTVSGDSLQRTLRFKDFVQAMAFVNRVAGIAEANRHHPDILVRYNKVTLVLSTHDAGGITSKDFELAKALEAAIAA